MIRLHQSLAAWNSPDFNEILKLEIQQLDAALLPLQQALSYSSHVADSGFAVMVMGTSDAPDSIGAKLGISYSGIIAGCSCADDPTPANEQHEYCEMFVSINRQTAEATFTLAFG